MMWNRIELKAKGKAAFRRNYWKTVLVALIIAAIVGAGAGSAGSSASQEINSSNQQEAYLQQSAGDDSLAKLFTDVETSPAVKATTAVIVVGGSTMMLALSILVLNPLLVGCRGFFTKNTVQNAGLGELGCRFRTGWGSAVGTMLLMDLFLFLWGLLLIVPAIIKSYSYRLVPYLLAEHPELNGTQAITISRRWMNGHKWNTFVLDLSFLGWELLSALTLGILGIFYVNPYKHATDAELYRAIADAHTGEAL